MYWQGLFPICHLMVMLTLPHFVHNEDITQPFTVSIVVLDLTLLAEKEYKILCEVKGSRPPPTITWWIGDQQVFQNNTQTSSAGYVTKSTLSFYPRPEDDGTMLRCIAENHATDTRIGDEWYLSVQYAPILRLNLGFGINGNTIEEGNDVYFQCSVSANPKVSLVSWRHNGEILTNDQSVGVILSNESLVLQKLTKEHEGDYSCHASNSIGDGTSNFVTLDIKSSPVCSRSQATTYAVAMGEAVVLNCSVQAKPLQASFTWTFNNSGELIDVAPRDFTSSSSHSIVNYRPMALKDYGTLMCWAHNVVGYQRMPCVFHVVPPAPPGTVAIMGPDVPLLAGKEYEVLCEVKGSRPPPIITWWIGDQQVFENNIETSSSDDVTKSTLSFHPLPEDDGTILRCVAENPATDTLIEDTKLLSVHYVPKAEVTFGLMIDENDLIEGKDTYLMCSVSANPKVSHVSWSHNGKSLVSDRARRVIFSSNSLVIQSMARENAGNYSCHARNIIGIGSSKNVTLDVKYSPVCASGLKSTYYVPIGEEVTVTCSVQANPMNKGFQWSLNTTENILMIPKGRFTSSGSQGIITYLLRSPDDYGSLMCLAYNDVGRQNYPCVFQIVPPEKPDPPRNCSVEVQAPASLTIICEEGNNGGLNQTFVLDARLLNSQVRVGDRRRAVRVTSSKPSFLVEGLEGGQVYAVLIRAFNDVGYSETRSFTVFIPLAEDDWSKGIQNGGEYPSSGHKPTNLVLYGGLLLLSSPIVLFLALI